MDKEQETKEYALTLRKQVDALQITDQTSYDVAQAINKQAYEGRKAFHVWFDPIDEASKAQRKAVIEQGKQIDAPFDYIIKTTGDRAAAWMAEERRKAEIVRQKAEVEARKKAEEKQLEEAEMLASLGMDDAADEALEAEPVIEKIKVDEPIKAEGVSVRTYYSAEVVDLKALVVAVAAGLQPLSYLQANQAALDGIARIEKDAFNVVGVRIVKETKQSRRF